MSWHLSNLPDFARHNAEVASLWRLYHEGNPPRVPVTFSGSIRNLLCNPELNTTGYSFRDFFEDPRAQIAAQLEYQSWCRHHLLCDKEMGPPADGWQLGIDLQNCYEAMWFGCPIRYDPGQVPDTEPILRERKEKLYDLAPPADLAGYGLGRAAEFYDVMRAECPKMEFKGLPVLAPKGLPGEGTDGPFNAACKLRGAAEVCVDMLTDEAYYRDLMNFITGQIIRRMKAARRFRWERDPQASDRGEFRRKGWGFADDAIALLSVENYREFVLPYHRKLASEFSDGGPISIHLCGDATRFFPLLRQELSVMSFDTGFPVDFGGLRDRLGPDVTIYGGPTIMLLKDGTPEEVRREVKRILETGVTRGRKFVLREANNLAPCTPIENCLAMYEAGKQYGRY